MSVRYPVPLPRPPFTPPPRVQLMVFLPAAPAAATELPFLTMPLMAAPRWSGW